MKQAQYSFKSKKNKGVILIAPLNWGLGHATRCIPIIRKLLKKGFKVVIASDTEALTLLQREFPELTTETLPAYNISYTKNPRWFKWRLMAQMPTIVKVMRAEATVTKVLVKKHGITGIISDNRFGVRHPGIPSVFITHQIQVLSGWSTPITSWLHQRIIKRFDQCWVPDYEGQDALSGALSQDPEFKFPTAYFGPISRIKNQNRNPSIDLLILLSGPEPQRSILENIMREKFKNYKKKVVMVCGVVQDTQSLEVVDGIEIHNFLTSSALEALINQSKLVISRSGYTTVMDLAKTKTPAFFIPTPGQYEQEYLAKRLSQNLIAPYCAQSEFDPLLLKQLDSYEGWPDGAQKEKLDTLFGIFQSK
jgi:uncharacterized protein (TIGR00661 family)